MSNIITNGIALECEVFNESIGAEKDLILVNYDDFDLVSTSSPYNRQVDDSLNNIRGLTDIFLKPGAVKHIFEGTDYSVIPTVTPEAREDGTMWYTHSISFTAYSKKSKDRETLISLGGAIVIAITKDRSTGLYELFGMYQGLMVNEISRTYTGSQNSNFYQVTISTPEIKVVKEPSLSELSIMLDGGTILPPAPTPGVYGDATPTVQGLVRVDSLEVNPIVYLKATADSLFARKDSILTTEELLEANKASVTKWPAAKAIVDWITSRFEPIINSSPEGTLSYFRGDKTWQRLNKAAVGLGNVDNTSDADKPIPDLVIIALENKADLVGGKVPASQLPSYISDVLEFADVSNFPVTGVSNTIYVAISPSNFQYRWSGSTYIQITNGGLATSDDLPEGTLHLYFTVTNFLANLTYSRIIAALGFTPENISNKQDSLAYDGTGTKYVTVDAVNDLALSINPELYVKKEESVDLVVNYGILTVINQIDLIDNRNSISLIGTATDVKSVQIPTAFIRPGKPHFFKNRTGHNVTLWHLSGTGNLRYFFSNGLNLVVKPDEVIEFNLNADDSLDFRLEFVGNSVSLDNYYIKSETDALDLVVLNTAKSYADGLVVGLLDLRGVYDASSNLFPTTSGSGPAGIILKGDLWYVSVVGILAGKDVKIGDSFFALVDSPGQTAGNWSVLETNLGYIPEDSSNKSTSSSDSASTVKFPVWAAIVSYFTQSQLFTILGISTLSGSNTGDETTATLKTKIDVEISYACSDETSNLTVGNLISFRAPYAMILSEVRISVNDAPTVSSLIVDVKEGGVSIFSTLLSIDASELTSVTAATPAVISDVNLADDALLTVSTTQVGSGNAGKGLKILFKGKRV
jgi:hypothetical protein